MCSKEQILTSLVDIKNKNQGDIIKEGQIIGFLDQFGNELPVKVSHSSLFLISVFLLNKCPFISHAYRVVFVQSDVAGEVLKVLCQDGGNIHIFNSDNN